MGLFRASGVSRLVWGKGLCFPEGLCVHVRMKGLYFPKSLCVHVRMFVCVEFLSFCIYGHGDRDQGQKKT